MLSYQKLIQEWPKLLMRPDAIEYLYTGLECAKIRRNSAILEVEHFIDECQQNQTTFFFFYTKPSRLIEQLSRTYLGILKEEVDAAFTEDEIKLLMSGEYPELACLIEKHGLLIFSDAGSEPTCSRAWR